MVPDMDDGIAPDIMTSSGYVPSELSRDAHYDARLVAPEMESQPMKRRLPHDFGREAISDRATC